MNSGEKNVFPAKRETFSFVAISGGDGGMHQCVDPGKKSAVDGSSHAVDGRSPANRKSVEIRPIPRHPNTSRRYLDPKNLPKTPSENFSGGLCMSRV